MGYYILIGVLLFAPLIRGGNRPVALLFLELAAVALAACLLYQPDFLRQLSRRFIALLAVLFALPLLYLIPLPFELWQALPGHALHAQLLAQLDAAQTGSGAMPASLTPALTEYSWLALLPPLAVFLFAVGLPTDRLRALVPVFLGIAAFQAILGLMQYGMGPASPLRDGLFAAGASAVGTYANYDHYAGILEMALPLSLAMLAATLGRTRGQRRHARDLAQKLAIWLARHLNQAAIYGLIALAVMLALVFSKSRTGIALGMLVVLLSTISFATRLGGRNVFGMIGTFIFVAASLAIQIGLVPVLNRFALQDPLQDARWSIFTSTLTAIGAYFPLGSGIGTYNQAYQPFHAPDLNGMFINRAHNDYLEWLTEGGLVAAALILAFLLLYCIQWTRVWKRGDWTTFNFIQVGAGIGMLAIALHSLLDFNLHIPANQIYLALLAALFFHRADDKTAPVSRDEVEAPPTHAPAPTQPALRPLAAAPGPNPFAD